MQIRPADYSDQPFFKELIKARGSAYEKIKAAKYDLTKLSQKVGVVKSIPSLNNNNDDYDDLPLAKTVVKPVSKRDPNDNDDDDDADSVIKPKPVVKTNDHDDDDDDDEIAIQKASIAKKSLLENVSKLKTHEKKKPVGPKINMFTGKIMDSEEVFIAGEKFIISYSEKNRTRRRDIFLEKDDEQKLTDVEKSLLDKLCITEDTYEAVRMYLYDFFESLPSCQSSIAVLSNRQCEVAYYVLWSVLLKARQDVQRKIDDAKKKSESDIKIQQYEARLKSMSVRNIAPYNGPKPCDESHDEHIEIESLIKRLEDKLDSVKTKVNSMKGGGCKLMDSMLVGNEATYKGVETPLFSAEAATGLQVGGALQELQRIYALYS